MKRHRYRVLLAQRRAAWQRLIFLAQYRPPPPSWLIALQEGA